MWFDERKLASVLSCSDSPVLITHYLCRQQEMEVKRFLIPDKAAMSFAGHDPGQQNQCDTYKSLNRLTPAFPSSVHFLIRSCSRSKAINVQQTAGIMFRDVCFCSVPSWHRCPRADGLESLAALVSSVEESPEAMPTTVRGTIPTWIEGSFLRNGPGKFEFGEERCRI